MLNVGTIQEGFVLDHIQAGKSMDIYKCPYSFQPEYGPERNLPELFLRLTSYTSIPSNVRISAIRT